METKIIFIYCLCEKFTKSSGIRDDNQCLMSSVEVMTFALTAALFFTVIIKLHMLISRKCNYCSYLLSTS